MKLAMTRHSHAHHHSTRTDALTSEACVDSSVAVGTTVNSVVSSTHAIISSCIGQASGPPQSTDRTHTSSRSPHRRVCADGADGVEKVPRRSFKPFRLRPVEIVHETIETTGIGRQPQQHEAPGGRKTRTGRARSMKQTVRFITENRSIFLWRV
jgi:hypothetical protein